MHRFSRQMRQRSSYCSALASHVISWVRVRARVRVRD